jgi:hypothetical protein
LKEAAEAEKSAIKERTAAEKTLAKASEDRDRLQKKLSG